MIDSVDYMSLKTGELTYRHKDYYKALDINIRINLKSWYGPYKEMFKLAASVNKVFGYAPAILTYCSLTPEQIVDIMQPEFKILGWIIEYSWGESQGVHVFYTHPKNEPKEIWNIRTASILTKRTIDTFRREINELLHTN